MDWSLTPDRQRGVEILDDPAIPPNVRERAMADLARSNALFGGTRSALRALRDVLPRLPARAVVLDVGTGLADVPQRVRRAGSRAGVDAALLGLDISEDLLRIARQRLDGALVGNALHLPLRDSSVDLVICSQVLHHFETGDARRLITELHRVARGWVVISDLRRSWFAAGGFWLASSALRFHVVTRLDGMTSVFRGFTPAELAQLVRDATGMEPRVRRGLFWRLSATWTKAPPPSAATLR
jgi:SAM-dependent methyltransferase